MLSSDRRGGRRAFLWFALACDSHHPVNRSRLRRSAAMASAGSWISPSSTLAAMLGACLARRLDPKAAATLRRIGAV